MTRINLLPWRETYRQERKKEFMVTAVAVVLLALVCSYGWNIWMKGRVDWQDSRNQLLRSEITLLNRQVAEVTELQRHRQQTLERTEVIQSLQSDRSDIVRIFDELVRAVPDGVYFTSLERRPYQLALQGFAESNNRVSSLMRQLDGSSKFSDSNLTRVVADRTLGEQGNRFSLLVNIQAPGVVAMMEASQ